MGQINKHHLEAMNQCLKVPTSKMGLERLGKENLGLLHDISSRTNGELVYYSGGFPIVTSLGRQKVKQYLKEKK